MAFSWEVITSIKFQVERLLQDHSTLKREREECKVLGGRIGRILMYYTIYIEITNSHEPKTNSNVHIVSSIYTLIKIFNIVALIYYQISTQVCMIIPHSYVCILMQLGISNNFHIPRFPRHRLTSIPLYSCH